MKRVHSILRRVPALAILLALPLAATAQDAAAPDRPAFLLQRLAQGLDLSQEQQKAIGAGLESARTEDGLWTVARVIQDQLSADQKERLFERAGEARVYARGLNDGVRAARAGVGARARFAPGVGARMGARREMAIERRERMRQFDAQGGQAPAPRMRQFDAQGGQAPAPRMRMQDRPGLRAGAAGNGDPISPMARALALDARQTELVRLHHSLAALIGAGARGARLHVATPGTGFRGPRGVR